MRALVNLPPFPAGGTGLKPIYLRDVSHLPREVVESEIRARVQSVYLGDSVVLARVLGRFKMYLRTDDVGFAAHVMLDGFWESWLTRFLSRIVQPGMTVVDVGANFGYHSLVMGDGCGTSGRLYAIEPNPQALALLRRTLDLNGLMSHSEIVSDAVGAGQDERLTLVVPAGEPKNAYVVERSSDKAGAGFVEIRSTTLDALLFDRGQVDLIKIDAEGAEPAIIEGAIGILERDKPHLVLEYNAARYREPAIFLDRLLQVYGKVHRLDFDGEAQPVAPDQVSSDTSGDDQLLYFARL